ncbi:putative Zinc finger protein MYND domain-containing protein, partial [Operophtera brumata]
MVEKDPQISALDVGELDIFVDSMEPSQIELIGNQSWVDWHIRLQKLNQQAVLEASSIQEELTKETLISSGKLPVLVYEAICIQVWRLKIYPQILKLEPAPVNTFGIYMVLYHEAAAVGLLETVLFHDDGAHCVSEVAGDLIDYAELECETAVEELDRQKRDLQFDISMRCISVVRYLAEQMEQAGIGALISTSLYKTHDVPSLMAHLLQLAPWRRNNEKGDLEVFN